MVTTTLVPGSVPFFRRSDRSDYLAGVIVNVELSSYNSFLTIFSIDNQYIRPSARNTARNIARFRFVWALSRTRLIFTDRRDGRITGEGSVYFRRMGGILILIYVEIRISPGRGSGAQGPMRRAIAWELFLEYSGSGIIVSVWVEILILSLTSIFLLILSESN